MMTDAASVTIAIKYYVWAFVIKLPQCKTRTTTATQLLLLIKQQFQ